MNRPLTLLAITHKASTAARKDVLQTVGATVSVRGGSKMRKVTLLAITILAGTHIAQGYYGQGWSPRYLPRAQRNPNYDRPDRDYEPGIVTPYRHRYDRDYREFQSMEPYRRYPPRRQDWDYDEE